MPLHTQRRFLALQQKLIFIILEKRENHSSRWLADIRQKPGSLRLLRSAARKKPSSHGANNRAIFEAIAQQVLASSLASIISATTAACHHLGLEPLTPFSQGSTH